MTPKNLFKWRHFQTDIILLGRLWYLRYPLEYIHLDFTGTKRRPYNNKPLGAAFMQCLPGSV